MSLKNKIGFFEENEGVRSWLRLASFIALLFVIISKSIIIGSIIFFNTSYSVMFYIYNIIDTITILGYVFIPKILQKKIENEHINNK
jgi:hypothetical protein